MADALRGAADLHAAPFRNGTTSPFIAHLRADRPLRDYSPKVA